MVQPYHCLIPSLQPLPTVILFLDAIQSHHCFYFLVRFNPAIIALLFSMVQSYHSNFLFCMIQLYYSIYFSVRFSPATTTYFLVWFSPITVFTFQYGSVLPQPFNSQCSLVLPQHLLFSTVQSYHNIYFSLWFSSASAIAFLVWFCLAIVFVSGTVSSCHRFLFWYSFSLPSLFLLVTFSLHHYSYFTVWLCPTNVLLCIAIQSFHNFVFLIFTSVGLV